MELTHRFTVPGSVEETWARFAEPGAIATLAECFPGAHVTSAEGDTFQGTVKVKLGPIALVYTGSGTFVEKDEAARRLVVDAKGRDKRGNGTAGATAAITMAAEGDGTAVQVDTDLNVTGKPAQFGRGVMQDVSDKLLGQFVACLEQQSSAPVSDEPEAPEASATPAADTPADPPPSALADATGAEPAEAAEQPEPDGPVSESPRHDAGQSSAAAPASRTGESERPSDDAIDLGSTVLPVLWKSYGWQIVIGLVFVIAVIVVLVAML